MTGPVRVALGVLVWTCLYCVFLAMAAAFVGTRAVVPAVVATASFLPASLALLWGLYGQVVNEAVLVCMLFGGIGGSYGLVHAGLNPAVRILLQGPVLMLTAYAIGRLLVTRIERSWHIAAAAVVGLLADLWSVFAASGVTRTILEQRPDVLDYLLVGFPIPGAGVRPILGIADYAFLAIFMMHAEKFGFDMRRSGVALVSSLVVTLLCVNGLGMGLPAVPFMATFFLVANARRMWDDFEVDRKNGTLFQ